MRSQMQMSATSRLPAAYAQHVRPAGQATPIPVAGQSNTYALPGTVNISGSGADAGVTPDSVTTTTVPMAPTGAGVQSTPFPQGGTTFNITPNANYPTGVVQVDAQGNILNYVAPPVVPAVPAQNPNTMYVIAGILAVAVVGAIVVINQPKTRTRPVSHKNPSRRKSRRHRR